MVQWKTFIANINTNSKCWYLLSLLPWIFLWFFHYSSLCSHRSQTKHFHSASASLAASDSLFICLNFRFRIPLKSRKRAVAVAVFSQPAPKNSLSKCYNNKNSCLEACPNIKLQNETSSEQWAAEHRYDRSIQQYNTTRRVPGHRASHLQGG